MSSNKGIGLPTLTVESVPIGSIHIDPSNLRRHPERNLDAIKASLARFGQQKPLVVDGDGVVRAGNGTLEAARALGWERIDVVRTPLTGSEATAYAISDNRSSELATWDDTALADTLRALQSEDFDLSAVGYRDDEVDALIEGLAREAAGGVGGDREDDLSGTYSRKIKAPIYEPKGERPAIADLYDHDKTSQLIAEIEAADLPVELTRFLVLAAERHTVFHFRNIAEFYAHADGSIQGLMERSGLVIIDFHKAIEHGFVRMTERIGALAESEVEEEGDDDG
jgi:ParB-like chromosome segregation protein Spo0J